MGRTATPCRAAGRRGMARQEAEVKAKAKADADRKVSEFLKSRGFKGDVNSKKSSMLKSKYPLHVAAKEQDAEMVKLLLSAGANRSLKNSSGYTPAQKAEKYNQQKKGDANSTAVLRALQTGWFCDSISASGGFNCT